MYENNNSSFPDNKQIINVLKEDDTVKKYMKKLMPFVAYVKVTFVISTLCCLMYL